MADERYVDAPPAGAAGWGDVWRENRRYKPGGALQSLFAKWFRRGGAAELDRQRDFNLALLDLLENIRRDIAAVRDAGRADVDTHFGGGILAWLNAGEEIETGS